VRKGEEQNFKRVVENIIKFKAAALERQKEKRGQPEDIFECSPSDLNDHLRVRARARAGASVFESSAFIGIVIMHHTLSTSHALCRGWWRIFQA